MRSFQGRKENSPNRTASDPHHPNPRTRQARQTPRPIHEGSAQHEGEIQTDFGGGFRRRRLPETNQPPGGAADSESLAGIHHQTADAS